MHRLRHETTISKNQFGFISGRLTMEAIYLLRRLMERYQDKKKDFSYGFYRLGESI